MSNILTGLIPDFVEAIDIVSMEVVGLLLGVNRDSSMDGLAEGQTAKVPIVPTPVGEDIVAGRIPPDTGDQTIPYREVTITKKRAFPVRWTGEEQYSMGVAGGAGYQNIRAQQVAQSLRGLVNEMEQDLAEVAMEGASRAYGTPGTTPMSTDLEDLAQVGKILTDNGAPPGDRHAALNTTTGVKVRKLGQLTKVNEAGSDTLLRQGLLIDPILGYSIRESAWLGSHTKGTGAGYVTNLGAPLAIGATAIAVDTGTGTVIPGDVVTFAGDSNKYVVKTALSGGSFSIQEPGLRQTLADGVAVTLSNSYAANVAYSRNAIIMATRVPAMPQEMLGAGPKGQLLDRVILPDPRTGIAFEFTAWGGYRMVRHEVAAVWGANLLKPEWIALLMG